MFSFIFQVVLFAVVAVAAANPGFLGAPAVATYAAAPVVAAPVAYAGPVVKAAPIAYAAHPVVKAAPIAYAAPVFKAPIAYAAAPVVKTYAAAPVLAAPAYKAFIHWKIIIYRVPLR